MSFTSQTGNRPERTLAILDVGHGNCAVLKDQKGVVVVDAGPGSGLLEFLVENGITHVDALLLSHADMDHIGGTAALLASKTVTIGRVCLNSDSAKGSDIWDDLVYELSRADNEKILRFDVALVHDLSGQFDQGKVRIEIIGPSKYLAAKGPGSTDSEGRRMSANSVSAVVRFVQDGDPILTLGGDIDEIGVDDIIKNQVDCHARNLVYPHHGGKGARNEASFVEKVCKLVQPSAVIFSVARGRAKHPLPEVIAAVRSSVKGVRIACTQLSEQCAVNVPLNVPTHLASVYARGRDGRRCCAGTIVIDLDANCQLVPDWHSHGAFIRAEAPTALCLR